MSDFFPNEVYLETGSASEKDFIKISGYCYKKIDGSRIVTDEPVLNDIFESFLDCEDCFNCKCGKKINFIVGGFKYQGSNVTFEERIFTVESSSTGWQEIAIESGFLNNNQDSINFKPTQIRCYDRRMDMSSGIYVSFEERNAEIAHFQYVTGSDLYERRNLNLAASTGEFGTPPDFSYQNQYDTIGIANKINTIKFKSDCDFDCPKQDITFRVRGGITENPDYLNLGGDYNESTTAWVYATCTGMPTTPGQIVECIPSGDGINLTEYFTQGYAGLGGNAGGSQVNKPNGYSVSMIPSSIDIVNMDYLTGTSGNSEYSVTGSRHFPDYVFGLGSYYSSYSSRISNTTYGPNQFYYLQPVYTAADVNFSVDLGNPFGIDYNKATNCMDERVSNSDFNVYYRHLGGNLLAEESDEGNSKGDHYSGCYQASEFADGIFKNGTYVPMLFSGIVTGNAEEYETLLNDLSSEPTGFASGIFCYQWYPSGDRSMQNNVHGVYGLMTGDYLNEEFHNHHRSVVYNSGPVNVGDPLNIWNIVSGNYPIDTAIKDKASMIVDFGSSKGYLMSYSNLENGIRFYDLNDGSENRFDNYAFFAAGGNMANLSEPEAATNTFVKPNISKKELPLTDSGNSQHDPLDSVITQTLDPDSLTAQNQAFSDIKKIKFQLSWKK